MKVKKHPKVAETTFDLGHVKLPQTFTMAKDDAKKVGKKKKVQKREREPEEEEEEVEEAAAAEPEEEEEVDEVPFALSGPSTAAASVRGLEEVPSGETCVAGTSCQQSA